MIFGQTHSGFSLKLLIFILLVIFLGLTAYTYFLKYKQTPKGVLILHGRIEGREVSVSSRIQARIIKLYKEESEKVKRGELLAELFPEEFEARYKAIKEELDASYQNKLMAESYLIKSKANLEQAKRDLERYKKLFEEGVFSKRELELAELNYLSALADYKTNQKFVGYAQAKYRSVKEKLREVETLYKETKIFSPLDGIVISRPAEEGELVNPGQTIYTLVNLQKVYVKVYLPEVHLGKIKLGAPARIYVDAYKDRFFEGKVTRIYEQAEFTPKNVETREERVNLVFGAEVSVDNTEELLKPGMPADVVIKIDPQAEWIRP